MKFAIVLAGCGQHDGSETHEVILTLLSLAQEKIAWEAFAPDIDQHHVTNHLTNEIEEGEKRNVLKESARLVRGRIKPITEARINDYDAIVFPGGVGAVTNLCDWYDKQEKFSFHSQIQSFIKQVVENKKPMGFICIAPMMIPKIFSGVKLTIGNDKNLAKQIEDLNSIHVNCLASDIVTDENHKIVSTPANMVANGIEEVYAGIHKLIQQLALMAS